MQSLNRNAITVKRSPLHGYGVFADGDIHAGDVIEECHMLLMDDSNAAIDNYIFGVGHTKLNAKYALPFGYGAIYNHADIPNTRYIIDEEHSLLIFCADRFIRAGEEILVNYGADWFSSREIALTQSSAWFKVRRFFKQHRNTVRSVLFTLALFVLIKIL